MLTFTHLIDAGRVSVMFNAKPEERIRAMLKANDLCSKEPERSAKRLVDGGFTPRYDLALEALRENIFGRIRREWHTSIEMLLDIMGQERLLQGNPLLERSIRNRFPYLDPLNHVQVELLKEHRAQNPDEQVLRGIQLTINGISAGLRNSG